MVQSYGVKHPAFSGIATLIKQAQSTKEELEHIARRIVRTFLRDPDFNNALQAYVNVCFTVCKIKNNILGVRTRSWQANFLLVIVAGIWISQTSVSQLDVNKVDLLIEKLNTPDTEWFRSKLMIVARYINAKLTTERAARAFKLPDEILHGLHALPYSIDEINSTLIQALHEQRKYGVKPAYFQDGHLHTQSEAWVILDTDDIRSPFIDPLGLNESTFAWFLLANHQSIRSLNLKQNTEGSLNRLGPDFDSYLSLFLQRNGEFSLQPNGLLPVKELFIAQGREQEYAIVRLINTLRLYNLTVPLRILNKLPRLPPAPHHEHDDLPNRIRRLLDPRLLIPRLRSITEEPSNVVRAFEAESDEDEERTLKRIRKHICVGHTRQLPPGHHASPRARMLAEQEGITLDPQETYVMKHTRGSEEAVQRPHRAIQR